MTANVETAISHAERLASIEAKLDTLLERSKEDRGDFGGRIRNLEVWRYGTGAAVVASIANLFSHTSGKG